jgi:hypothetical protein
VPYRDLGHNHFDRLDRDRHIRYHTRRLADLGVVLPAPAPASPANRSHPSFLLLRILVEGGGCRRRDLFLQLDGDACAFGYPGVKEMGLADRLWRRPLGVVPAMWTHHPRQNAVRLSSRGKSVYAEVLTCLARKTS